MRKLNVQKTLWSERPCTILVIRFWNFTMFQYRFQLPQVMLNLIFSMSLRVLSQDVRKFKTENLIRKLGNIGKFSNLVEDIAQCLVFPPEIKLWLQQSKITQCNYQTFLVPSKFTGFIQSISNISFGIAVAREKLPSKMRVLLYHIGQNILVEYYFSLKIFHSVW